MREFSFGSKSLWSYVFFLILRAHLNSDGKFSLEMFDRHFIYFVMFTSEKVDMWLKLCDVFLPLIWPVVWGTPSFSTPFLNWETFWVGFSLLCTFQSWNSLGWLLYTSSPLSGSPRLFPFSPSLFLPAWGYPSLVCNPGSTNYFLVLCSWVSGITYILPC